MLYNHQKFNEILREMIEKSDFTIYSLSKQSGLNRTTLQKVLSGERSLSEEQLMLLLPYFHLTPSEVTQLLEAFQIDQLGLPTYLRCEYIKDLVENIRIENINSYHYPDKELIQIQALKAPYTCRKQVSILNLVYSLVYESVQTNSESYLYLFAPFDNDFVTHILSLFQNNLFKNLKISHLIPFVKGNKTDESGGLTNMQMLSFILPFIFNNQADYTANYYYEKSQLSKTQVPFPYYLVTNNHVLLLSGDYETALLLDNDIHDHYLDSFIKLRKHSSPLLQHTQSPLAVLDIYSTIPPQKNGYSLEKQPCIIHCIDEDMPSKLIYDSCPAKDHIMAAILQRHKQLKNMKESVMAFSYNGLISFCQEGRLFGYPDDFYRPFNASERKTILNRMLELNQEGSQLFLLTDKEVFRPCEKLTVFSNGSEAVFAFTNENDYKICTILETSITLAIKDFTENAVKLHLLNTVQDTNMAIQDAIAKIPTD